MNIVTGAKAPEFDPFYYLTNFSLMVEYAYSRYLHFFSDDERILISGLLQLPRETQALFVRLFNRKGPVFCVEKLRYEEIGDVTPHLDLLARGSWVSTSVAEMQCEDLLGCLTVPELRCLDVVSQRKPTKSRAEILEQLLQHETEVKAELETKYHWVEVVAKDLFKRLTVLFFCNRHQDLSDFVKVDLGHMHFESYAIDEGSLFFRDRQHLEQYLAWGKVLDEVHEWVVDGQLDAVIEACQNARGAWVPDSPWSASLARIQKHGARALERQGLPAEALEIYEDLLSWEYHDEWASRQILCLERLGLPEDALTATKAASENSGNPGLTRFFRYHMRKNQKALGLEAIEIPAKFSPLEREFCLEKTGSYLGSKAAYAHGRGDEVSVEDAVLVEFARRGWQGVFAENGYIRTICGLLAWDVVFAPIPGAFQHPFQGGPLDLNEPTFYTRRKDLFANLVGQLGALSDVELVDLFRRQYEKKADIFCFLNQASRFRSEDLIPFVENVGSSEMAKLVNRFFKSFRYLRRGFPDLVIWRDDELRCVEVKGPGDQLRGGQLIWLELLTELDIKAEVVKIRPGIENRE